jgi:hypothetical protein
MEEVRAATVELILAGLAGPQTPVRRHSRAPSASRSSLRRVPSLLQRLAVDITPLRESRDLRLLVLGNVVSGLGPRRRWSRCPTSSMSRRARRS